MKPLGKSYEDAQPYTSGSARLPVGGYVLKILNVKYQESENKDYSDQIIFSFDIEEGDHAGFFRENYDSQTGEDRKWKGTYRLWVPKDDGTERDNWTMRRFKTVMNSFEDSNNGFRWAWDEQTLKGKLIGGIFREREYEIGERSGFFVECGALTDVESIRSGSFKPLETKYLDNKPDPKTSDVADFVSIPEGTDMELPF